MHWLSGCLLITAVAAAPAAVTDLAAQYRNGQTFVTWRESGDLKDARFTVLTADKPIERVDQPGVTILARRLLPGSACDWWLDPETYGNPVKPDANGVKPPRPHEGWRIVEGGPKLDPDSGLFVHTVTAATAGARYYAVVDERQPAIAAGQNSLAAPVTQQVDTPQPIWQGDPASRPKPGAGAGRALDLVIHAKTGQGLKDWLMFGDATLGWREGLPFKYGLRVGADTVTLMPTDRTWIDRMFPEGLDECQKLTPAIHSFWFGYNEFINEPEKMPQGKVIAYTERRLLWLVRWTQAYYGTDPNRSYCTGSSMGGCGTISFGLHHPDIFAACAALVPIVAYDAGKGGDSARRVAKELGSLDQLTEDGVPARVRLDSTRFVREFKGDLPPLVIINGRNDGSIPWWKNPDFYRALRDRRQAFVAAWNEGDHATADSLIPPDMKTWQSLAYLHRYALNRSYVAFSRSSVDDEPGNGDKADGTPVGFMNRGLEAATPVDEVARYSVDLRWTLEPAKLPLTVDVTPRRVQAFKLKPGETVKAEVTDLATGQVVQTCTATVDADGLLTIPQVKVTGEKGNRLVLSR